MVTLLVGARYGVSQVVNHKLSILSPLTDFSSITRIELLPESDKVSLVKIYLQDIKVGTRTLSLVPSSPEGNFHTSHLVMSLLGAGRRSPGRARCLRWCSSCL